MLNYFFTKLDYKFFTEFFLLYQGLILCAGLTLFEDYKRPISYKEQIFIGRYIVFLFTVVLIIIVLKHFGWIEPFVEKYAKLRNPYIPSYLDESLSFFLRCLICLSSIVYFFIIVEFSESNKLYWTFFFPYYFGFNGLLSLCICDHPVTAGLSVILTLWGFYLNLWLRANKKKF